MESNKNKRHALIGLLIIPLFYYSIINIPITFGLSLFTGEQNFAEVVKVGYKITQEDIDSFIKYENRFNSFTKIGLYLTLLFGAVGFYSSKIKKIIGNMKVNLINRF